MPDVAVIAAVFGLIFVAELPDKTAVAGLVLGTRYPWRRAFVGIAGAFATHVAIAVVAGSLLTLLPRRPVEAVVGALFLLGAVLVWREGREDPQVDGEQVDGEQVDGEDVPDIAEAPRAAGFWRVAGLGYGIIFVAEWGDLTQILTANLTAKYDDPLSVAIGAVLGLWAVGLIAVLGGKTLLRVLPIIWITRVAALVMTALAIYSITLAARA